MLLYKTFEVFASLLAGGRRWPVLAFSDDWRGA